MSPSTVPILFFGNCNDEYFTEPSWPEIADKFSYLFPTVHEVLQVVNNIDISTTLDEGTVKRRIHALLALTDANQYSHFKQYLDEMIEFHYAVWYCTVLTDHWCTLLSSRVGTDIAFQEGNSSFVRVISVDDRVLVISYVSS